MSVVLLTAGTVLIMPAAAQFQQGGIDHPGEWHVGEGLKQGDYFSYNMCHVDYKECAEFTMDMWIEGDVQVGTETKWLAHVVVYDGNAVVVGQMELGKVAPEPTGGSSELGTYRSAFKSSVVWLSAFANANEPKAFAMPSWGKIANIGGEQILPKELVEGGLDTRAGHFEEVMVVGWRTGGATSNIWVVDGFPFPIQALTWTHVSEGIPPKEYEFELVEYREGVVENPLAGIVSTAQQQAAAGCPPYDMFDQSIRKSTALFKYQVQAFFAPDPPMDGCPMKILFKFISKYDDTRFLNQVQYDVWVVNTDEEGNPLQPPLRSIADEEGRLFLFSPSGQSEVEFIINESGHTNYLLFVYGLSPINIVPSADQRDWLLLPMDVQQSAAKPAIPQWIKNTAMWWSEGTIDDNSFVQGLQFLIVEGIIEVEPQDASGDGQDGPIPQWIKNTAMWWANGDIDDQSFLNAIQFLIVSGVIQVS